MKRTTGKYAGEHAELTISENGTARITFEIREYDARKLAVAAVANGGELDLLLEHDGRRVQAKAIEARVDTLDGGSQKLSGPNVVSFSNLKLK